MSRSRRDDVGIVLIHWRLVGKLLNVSAGRRRHFAGRFDRATRIIHDVVGGAVGTVIDAVRNAVAVIVRNRVTLQTRTAAAIDRLARRRIVTRVKAVQDAVVIFVTVRIELQAGAAITIDRLTRQRLRAHVKAVIHAIIVAVTLTACTSGVVRRIGVDCVGTLVKTVIHAITVLVPLAAGASVLIYRFID